MDEDEDEAQSEEPATQMPVSFTSELTDRLNPLAETFADV
jgi:hypothetical protein